MLVSSHCKGCVWQCQKPESNWVGFHHPVAGRNPLKIQSKFEILWPAQGRETRHDFSLFYPAELCPLLGISQWFLSCILTLWNNCCLTGWLLYWVKWTRTCYLKSHWLLCWVSWTCLVPWLRWGGGAAQLCARQVWTTGDDPLHQALQHPHQGWQGQGCLHSAPTWTDDVRCAGKRDGR